MQFVLTCTKNGAGSFRQLATLSMRYFIRGREDGKQLSAGEGVGTSLCDPCGQVGKIWFHLSQK